ncbi:MAG: ABC transporter substrate-binding protein [Muribaculaceae bacterium]|nr:ABC transporter substrate-binding protein [Muribaculaceae bacterium]
MNENMYSRDDARTAGCGEFMRVWRLALMAVLAAMLSVAAAGCRGGDGGSGTDAARNDSGAGNLMEEARLLRMTDGDGFVMAEVVNPWDTTRLLGRYLLVERGVEPDSLPGGEYERIEVPVERALVFSSVHGGVISELGAGGRIAGVADGGYFTREPLAGRIRRGEVRDVGSSMAPSVEAVVALGPDVMLVSPFENAGHGALEQTGVPVVECADYMEATPKGRAEWVRILGVLFGERARADSLYRSVSAAYDSIAADAAESGSHPLVLTEQLQDGYWFVPGGRSYMARLICDAGGRYPWADNEEAGSLQLDFSSVYARAGDADVWLIRSFGHETSLDDLRGMFQLNSQFKAFKNGNVWVANTAEVPLYDEFPFHPEFLLEEYARIFSGKADGLRYFRRAR